MKILYQPEDIRPWMEDESKKRGRADRIYFPETEDDVRRILRGTQGPITMQGGLTGVTAGAVPDGGIVINLSHMTGILKEPQPQSAFPRITVRPGIRLLSLREHLQRQGLFFAPDPTETTATLGGMVSCNSSGARSFHYGATRDHVRGLRMVLADGDSICLQRGESMADGNAFRLVTGRGRVIEGTLPDLRMPQVRKHTAGYYIRPDMDLLDLFIGSEGTLGVITEICLDLLPLPAHLAGAVVFFAEESEALRFTRLLRETAPEPAAGGGSTGHTAGDESAGQTAGGGGTGHTAGDGVAGQAAGDGSTGHTAGDGAAGQAAGGGGTGHTAGDGAADTRLSELPLPPLAIEFFGKDTLSMLRAAQSAGAALTDLPRIPEGCAIYTEFASNSRAELQHLFRCLAERIRLAGGDPYRSWAAFRGPDMDRLKEFRHAAPVCVNEKISEIRKTCPGITKLGTDMSVPDSCLEEIFAMYRRDLGRGGFLTSVFGHIGNDHLHCNIIPRSEEEYALGKALYARWAEEVVRMGGSVSAEHGVGKLKIWLLQKLYSEKELRAMTELKRLFDPQMRLDPGNIFPGD